MSETMRRPKVPVGTPVRILNPTDDPGFTNAEGIVREYDPLDPDNPDEDDDPDYKIRILVAEAMTDPEITIPGSYWFSRAEFEPMNLTADDDNEAVSDA